MAELKEKLSVNSPVSTGKVGWRRVADLKGVPKLKSIWKTGEGFNESFLSCRRHRRFEDYRVSSR